MKTKDCLIKEEGTEFTFDLYYFNEIDEVMGFLQLVKSEYDVESIFFSTSEYTEHGEYYSDPILIVYTKEK